MMRPLIDNDVQEGFPPRASEFDRSIYTDTVTGCRYVLLDRDIWFLWIDLSVYTGTKTLPDRFARSFLPLEFIPGQGCRLTIVDAGTVGELFSHLQARVEGMNLGEVLEQWAGHVDKLRSRCGLETKNSRPPVWIDPRTNIYYFRRGVPAALRDQLGWEIKRSLNTKDLEQAYQRWPAVSEWANQLLAEARRPSEA